VIITPKAVGLTEVTYTQPAHHVTSGLKVRAGVNNTPGKVVRLSHATGVTANGTAATDGYPLLPGEEFFIPGGLGDGGVLYMISDAAAQHVTLALV
jgi:hypothetical protein